MPYTFVPFFIKDIVIKLFLLLFLLSVPLIAESGDSYKEMIILLDQSASLEGLVDKKEVNDQVVALLDKLKYPYEITLVGFSDVISRTDLFRVKNEKDRILLFRELEQRKFKGITTDFEVPFRYLLEKNENSENMFAVVISDGEPEIWDEKRWFLSKRIRKDSRYEALNKKYRLLKTKYSSFKTIYEKLFSFYQSKNFNFIEQQLPLLQQKYGDRLFFLDISKGSDFFKEWSALSGAVYINASSNPTFSKKNDREAPIAPLPVIVLLLDRSGSMRHVMKKKSTKHRLAKVLKRFDYPFQITLAGFTDAMQEPSHYKITNETELNSLVGHLAMIPYKGITTDFEMPFRFILGSLSAQKIDLAIILSDGEPEIWDEKRWFLSARIRTDSRYEELNRQYALLKKQKTSFRNIYKKLLSSYTTKNVQFIENTLIRLKNEFENRLVFIDLSNESSIFRKWAKSVGGEYVPLIARSPHVESPVFAKKDLVPPPAVKAAVKPVAQPVIKPVETLYNEEIVTEKEVQPQDEQKTLIKTVSTAPNKSPVQKMMQSAIAKEKKSVYTTFSDPPPEKEAKGWGEGFFFLLFLFLILILIFLYFRLRKGDLCTGSTQPSQLIPEIKSEKRVESIEEDGKARELQEKNLKISNESEEAMQRYIDDEVAFSVEQTDELRITLLKEEEEKLDFHGSVSFAHPVPPGTITATLKKQDLTLRRSVLATTTKILTLEGVDLCEAEVKSIFFNQGSVTLQVEKSTFLTEEGNSTTFLLNEFVDNIDDRMKWLELISRTGGD